MYVWDTHTHTHTHHLYPFSHEKNKILTFATIWIELEVIILNEVSQTGKDKYCMIALTCGIQKAPNSNRE